MDTSRISISCKHCGSELRARTMDLYGHAMFCGYEQCTCPGAVREREMEQSAVDRRLKAEAEQRRVNARRLAGIPLIYENAAHPAAPEIAHHALDHENVYVKAKSLEGCGAVAAASIILIDAGANVLYTPMTEIANSIREGAKKGEDGTAKYRAPKILAVTDLSIWYVTEYVLDQVCRLFKFRNEMMLPTIVAACCMPGELIDRFSRNCPRDMAYDTVAAIRMNSELVGI